MAAREIRQELRFALYAIKKNIQGSAELRVSFLTNVIGMALNNTAFILLWVFFVKSVGIINGWTAMDIVGMQGFSALSYGIVFSAAVGIRSLPEYVASGAFDRFMLSPKNVLVRVATAAFNASGLGDILFGVVCLTFYAVSMHAGLGQVLLIVWGVVISALVFLAVAIAAYSTSFLFTDATSASTSLFELFLTPSLFHGGAFQGAMRFFFTFIIPSLLVGALPVEVVRHVSAERVVLVTALALAWFLLALWLFHRGTRKYESSNLMTFGS